MEAIKSEVRRAQVRALSLVIQADSSLAVPAMIWGPPGIGKTASIKQIAKILGRNLEIVIASSKDPADVIGIDYIVDDPKLGKISTKIPPSWAVRAMRAADAGKKTIVFFDEITTAPLMVQNVLLSTMQDRLLGDLFLPYEHIYLCAAGNPSEITGENLSQAMANRLFHMEWNYERSAFIKFLMYGEIKEDEVSEVNPNAHDKYQALRKLLAIYIDNIKDFAGKGPVNDELREKPHPTPRSTDNMLKLLSLVKEDDPYAKEIEDLFALGTVGGDGLEFLTWLRKKSELPSVNDVLEGKAKLDFERLDLLFLLGYQVINEFKKIVDNQTKRKDFVGKLVKFLETLCDNRVEVVPVVLRLLLEEYKSAQVNVDDAIVKSAKLTHILAKITRNF